MDKQILIEQLQQEGFENVVVCPNDPNVDFGEHTHPEHTVHVILEGELILTDGEETQVIKAGDRFEIPAGTTHSAKTGPHGCTFVVGVKR